MAKSELREAVCTDVVRFLRDERKRQGTSMEVLAQKAGLSQSMISLVERDLRNPTLDTLLRMSEVLNVDLGEVISRSRRASLKKHGAP